MSERYGIIFNCSDHGAFDEEQYLEKFKKANIKCLVIRLLYFEYMNLSELKVKLGEAERYDGLIINNPLCIKAIKMSEGDISSWKNKKTYVCSKEMEKLAQKELGLKTECNTSNCVNDGFAKFIIKEKVSKPLLLPTGNISRELVQKLRNSITVDHVVVFKTCSHPNITNKITSTFKNYPIKYVLFMSPIAVKFAFPAIVKSGVQIHSIRWASRNTETQVELVMFLRNFSNNLCEYKADKFFSPQEIINKDGSHDITRQMGNTNNSYTRPIYRCKCHNSKINIKLNRINKSSYTGISTNNNSNFNEPNPYGFESDNNINEPDTNIKSSINDNDSIDDNISSNDKLSNISNEHDVNNADLEIEPSINEPSPNDKPHSTNNESNNLYANPNNNIEPSNTETNDKPDNINNESNVGIEPDTTIEPSIVDNNNELSPNKSNNINIESNINNIRPDDTNNNSNSNDIITNNYESNNLTNESNNNTEHISTKPSTSGSPNIPKSVNNNSNDNKTNINIKPSSLPNTSEPGPNDIHKCKESSDGNIKLINSSPKENNEQNLNNITFESNNNTKLDNAKPSTNLVSESNNDRLNVNCMITNDMETNIKPSTNNNDNDYGSSNNRPSNNKKTLNSSISKLNKNKSSNNSRNIIKSIPVNKNSKSKDNKQSNNNSSNDSATSNKSPTEDGINNRKDGNENSNIMQTDNNNKINE